MAKYAQFRQLSWEETQIFKIDFCNHRLRKRLLVPRASLDCPTFNQNPFSNKPWSRSKSRESFVKISRSTILMLQIAIISNYIDATITHILTNLSRPGSSSAQVQSWSTSAVTSLSESNMMHSLFGDRKRNLTNSQILSKSRRTCPEDVWDHFFKERTI